MRWPLGNLLFYLVLTGLLASTNAASRASAQVPGGPGHGADPRRQPQTPGGQIMNVPASQPAPVVPDTVEIRFTVPDSLPQPVAFQIVQDTLTFGGLLHLVLDYAPGLVDGPQLRPLAEGQWLIPFEIPEPGFWSRLVGQDNAPELNLTGLGETDNLRVVRSYRVYRRDPLQILWQDWTSPVIFVQGQTAGLENTATIRAPRSLTWSPWKLILLGFVVLALVLLVYGWWRRRQASEPLSHWVSPPPAWVAAATGLQALMAENILARGDTRLFMDRLASLGRSYVAGRYRIPAREMTGGEMIQACRALGHDPAHPAGFAQLIDRTDRERYNPTAPESAFCREQAVQFVGRLNRVRLVPRYVAVPAEQLIAAEQAWASVVAELGIGAGRAVRTADRGPK